MATILLPKQRLKDYCRRKRYPAPIYVLTGEERVDLHKHYTIEVIVDGIVNTEARGLSRRIAEFKAAIAAINLIGQSDASVFDNPVRGSTSTLGRFGRSSGGDMFGRSFSVDHISRAQRTDSIPSMMSLAPMVCASKRGGGDEGTSIDGIDSLTENGDSLYGSEPPNGFDVRKNDCEKLKPSPISRTTNEIEEEEVSSDSIDEGVYVEISESSSSTPGVSSPVSSATFVPGNESESTVQSKLSPITSTAVVGKLSNKNLNVSKNETNKNINNKSQIDKSKSFSSSILSSFFFLSSLRTLSRRSFRRRKSGAKVKENIFLQKEPADTAAATEKVNFDQLDRPISSSSTNSYSSTFSSNSSCTNTQSSSITSSSGSPSSSSSTSGSFVIPDYTETAKTGVSNKYATTNTYDPINSYSNIIAESIIEEEEEEEEEEKEEEKNRTIISKSHSYCNRKESLETAHSADLLCSEHNTDDANNASHCSTLPRSMSSQYVLASMCPHNHFSIYGPVICSNSLNRASSGGPMTIEATPSAALLRYCVRMYLPLPYYDIRFDHDKFYVTCRVLLTPSKMTISSSSKSSTEPRTLPVTLPEQYRDRDITARGNGDTLRAARNMAAQTIIDKLRNAQIYFEL